MPDPLHVNVITTSLGNRFNDPAIRKKALAKFQEMRRELRSIEMAMSSIERAIQSNVQFPDSQVARAKQQLRDWILSLVESEAYIEVLLGGHGGFGAKFDILASRAAPWAPIGLK